MTTHYQSTCECAHCNGMRQFFPESVALHAKRKKIEAKLARWQKKHRDAMFYQDALHALDMVERCIDELNEHPLPDDHRFYYLDS